MEIDTGVFVKGRVIGYRNINDKKTIMVQIKTGDWLNSNVEIEMSEEYLHSDKEYEIIDRKYLTDRGE